MTKTQIAYLLSATGIFCCLPNVAWTAEEMAGDDTLETVIVTATKVQTEAQKTPISMSVRNGDELRELNLRRVDEILQSEPSVAIQETQVGPQFYLRGIGQNTGIPSPTNQQPVALYIDGVYQPRNETVRGGMLDLERIEVLRGPQGTYLGGAAFAGAVSLVTVDPKFDNEGKVTLGAGNLDETTAEGVANLKVTDNVAVRVAGSTNKRRGYYSSGLEDSNTKIARLKLRYQPFERLNMVLSGEYQKIGGIGPGQGSLSDTKNSDGTETTILHNFRNRSDPWDDGTPYGQSGGSPLGFRHTVLRNISLVANYDFPGFATLTVIPAFQDAKYEATEAQRGPQRNGENRKQQTKSLEVRLASDPSYALRWLLGAYYYHTDFSGWFTQETIDVRIPGGPPVVCPNNAISCVSYNYAGGDTLTSKSVFGNVTLPLLDNKLRLLGGLRYSVDDTHFDETAPVGNATAPTGTTPDQYLQLLNPTFVQADDRTSRTTFLIGTEYDLTDDAMLYVRWAEGYKKGNVSLSFVGTVQRQLPEILTDRAIGIKSRWFNNRLQINAEYFNNYYDNYAITACTPLIPGGCEFPLSISRGTTNVSLDTTYPKVWSKGVDLNFEFKLTARDLFQFNASYLQSTFGSSGPLSDEQLASATADPVLQTALQAVYMSYAGATLQNAPKWAMNASYEHRFTLASYGDLSLRGEWVHKSDLYSNLMGGSVPNDPVAVQPTYDLYNASVTYRTPEDKYSVTGYVRNLTNYPVMTNYSPGAADLGPPRQFGVTVSGKF